MRGAREHNLKDVSLAIPRDALVVFTGLSGSGKSSLAFDTIFAEGQRRYVESLSAYARQFLGQMDKPDVDFIDGLSPAVSIDQKSTSRNPRSTVGTITEVYDYLRLLFARIGKPHCPSCGEPVGRQTPQQIVDRVLELPEGTRFQVLAPVVRERKGEYSDLFRQLQAQGFSRARVDGTVHLLTEPPTLKKQQKHTIEVVVDRLAVKASARRRLTDSVETALGLAGGIVNLEFVDAPAEDPDRERLFSEHLVCLNDGQSFEDLEPRSFSFNSPVRRVRAVHRPGHADGGRPRPDRARSGPLAGRRGRLAVGERPHLGVLLPPGHRAGRRARGDVDTPFKDLPDAMRDAVLYGYNHQVHVTLPQPVRPRALVHDRVRGRHPVRPAPARRVRDRLGAGALRGLHARGAVPGVRRRAAQARARWRSPSAAVQHRHDRASCPSARPPAFLADLDARPTATRRSPSGCSRRSTSGWRS